MTGKEYAVKIPQLEEIYVIYSALTRSPYVSCEEEDYQDEINYFDEVIMYTQEEAAKEKVKELGAADIPVVAMKVLNEQMLHMFSELYLFGVDGLRIYTQEGSFFYLLEELVRRPDYSKLAENQKPLENPRLQLSMLYFMQEVRKKTVDKTSPKIHELEEEMLANVLRSSYLVPVREAEKDGEKVMEVMLVKMKDDDESSMVPIFSDAVVFSRYKRDEIKGLVMSIDNISKMALPQSTTGYLINPNSVSVPIKRELLDKMMQTSTWKV